MPTNRKLLLSALLLGTAPTALYAQDAAPQSAAPRAAPQSAAPQRIATPQAAQQDMMADDEIVVTGQVERGAVVGDIKPEQQLNAADIRSYGVSSVSELLNELAPQTNAGGGAPVVLLNGKRISGFQEIQDIPAEAIQRVDILPEEVSLKYGYSPNQKVVNIVLRARFRAFTGELRGAGTTSGGRENGQASGNLLRIAGDNRMTVDLKYSRADDLLESDRGIQSTAPSRPFALAGNVTGATGATQIDPALSTLAGRTVTVAGAPASAANGRPTLSDFIAGANNTVVSDISDYRTLSPKTSNLALNATLARVLPGNISASLNGRIERTTSDSLQGLPGATLTLPTGNPFSPFSNPVLLYRYLADAGPLAQSVEGVNGHVGLSLNGDLKPWRWSFTGAYDLTDTKTRTDRSVDTTGIQAALVANSTTVNPFGTIAPSLLSNRLTDTARAKTQGLSGEFLISGPLFKLPAGTATTSVTIGASTNSFDSTSLRSGVAQSLDFTRSVANGQASIDLPITSRRYGVLPAIGDVSLNFNVASQQLSDFGTLSTFGYGVRWTPIPKIRFLASMSQDRSAPTGQQVNNPTVITPNVSVFDYLKGTSVFVTQIGGGVSNLVASDRKLLRLGLTIKPFDKKDLTLTANFTRAHTDNPIAAFPSPTPQIEAAFPQRFSRDANGNLLQIDARPINYDHSESSQLRWGFNFSVPIKSHIQKEVEAWRAAGGKREDMPADLQALRQAFQAQRQRDGGGEGNRSPGDGQNQGDSPNNASGDRPQNPSGTGAGGDGSGPRGGFGGPGAGGPGGGGFGGGRGGGGGASGRLQFAVYHTWHLVDRITIAPGVPELNLLDGDATGNSGGQARHEVQVQAGYSNNGIGARLSGNWQSSTRVDGALGTNSTLRFSSLATADLRLFANIGQMPQLIARYPFLRGSRVSIGITNIFNARQDVTDATGMTPLRYQPGYLDPLGRSVSISFRKLFF